MTKLAWFGVGLTTVYLIGLATLIKANWPAFSVLEPNAWGDFLAGSLGPLGIFWLVLGFFQQGRELQNSVNALNLQAQELRQSVEQQKAMVGITEKQLNLDIEVREEQIKKSVSRELPYLKLHYHGGSSGSNKRSDRLTILNVGDEDAVDVLLSCTHPNARFSPPQIPFIGSREQTDCQFVFEGQYTQAFSEGFDISISMTNPRGKKRTQVVKYGDGGIELLRTNPPQL